MEKSGVCTGEFYLTLLSNSAGIKMKKIFLFLFFFQILIIAQDESNINLSGVFSFDKQTTIREVKLIQDSLNFQEVKRSPLLAGFLSAVIPGTGQVYNKDYFKAGIFLLIDAIALTTAIIYDNKADDKTDFFENFAEQHWDARRYAQWTVNNALRLSSSIDPNEHDLLNVFNNDGSVNWNKLNALEIRIGTYYSHQLAPYQDQQYYEMIGKYAQFNPGWDDFTEDPNDPFTYTHERKDPLTDKFYYYASVRGEANDFYNTASKAVLIMVVNHVLSAAEAAWSASRYNKKLSANVSLEKKSIGFVTDYYPRLNLQYNL